MGGAESAAEGGAVVVYWRPGCGFCLRLLNVFQAAGVTFERRNIWEDDDARRFVAEHNRGNEIVPTVVLDDEVLTNPDPRKVVARIASAHPELVAGG